MAKKETYWAKVLFREFIAHYVSLSDSDAIKDLRQSVVALATLDGSGNSFGAKMVNWANERVGELSAVNTANGKKGGRPPKLPPTSRIPDDFQDVIDWCNTHGHGKDIDDARQVWDMTNDRFGHDADGNKIENWWGYLVQCLKTKKENRT